MKTSVLQNVRIVFVFEEMSHLERSVKKKKYVYYEMHFHQKKKSSSRLFCGNKVKNTLPCGGLIFALFKILFTVVQKYVWRSNKRRSKIPKKKPQIHKKKLI